MTLTKIQDKLLEFVTKEHGEQKRKYTGEPYANHCVEVASIISKYENDCIEIALCHDLYEDTDCDFDKLYDAMVSIGYDREYSYNVCACVDELTDVYTTEQYPHYNRKKRKELESKRLGGISYKSQSVKYADLINNTSSIVENDKGFAKVYLNEKKEILNQMIDGNKMLLMECVETLLVSIKKIKL